MRIAILTVVVLYFCPASFAISTITTRVEDAKAIYVDSPANTGNDSAALQAAIDRASGAGREGIVFVAAGRYTLTQTVFLWPGVRLIGYGPSRPVFLLPPKTPGFQKGMGVMVMFTGLAPHEQARAGLRIAFSPPGSVPPNNNVADANPNTFYSAMSNIDFEILRRLRCAFMWLSILSLRTWIFTWARRLQGSTRRAMRRRTCTSMEVATEF